MKYIKYIYILICVTFVSCESMEDTYKDMRGDGRIRYVGKCTDLEIETGWHRFKLSWKNSLDATVDKIKIKWHSDEVLDSVFVEGNATSYETDAIFDNKTYAFELCAIDINGKQSLKTTAYARAYTYEHEEVIAFGAIEDKYFFIDDKLILLLGKYRENVSDVFIEYYKEGSKQKIEIIQDDFYEKYIVVEGVDNDKDVVISRSAIIDECLDKIELEKYVLERNTIKMNTDFKRYLQIYYNKEVIDNEFMNSLEDLYLDYDFISIEDILYFPNLKNVVLGSQRFMDDEFRFNSPSMLTNFEASVFALKKANEFRSVNVKIYNNQYNLINDLDFAEDMGNPVIPEIIPLDNRGWTLTCSTDVDQYQSHPEYILDNDVETVWKPMEQYDKVRSHEITIDMQESKELQGFLVRQPKNYAYNHSFFPKQVSVLLSKDGSKWNEAKGSLIESSISIGTGRGETTQIVLPETRTARYVKLIVKDQLGYNKFTYLADFIIY